MDLLFGMRADQVMKASSCDHGLPTRNTCQRREKERGRKQGKREEKCGKRPKVQFRDFLTNLKMLLCAEGTSIIAGYASLKWQYKDVRAVCCNQNWKESSRGHFIQCPHLRKLRFREMWFVQSHIDNGRGRAGRKIEWKETDFPSRRHGAVFIQ